MLKKVLGNKFMSNFCNLFSIIKQGFINKKLKVKVRNNLYFLSLVEILYKQGYIRGYSISKDSRTIFIFLKYFYKKSVITNLFITSKPSKRFWISFKNLKRLSRERNSFGIVSTDKGLMTIDACLLNKKGGELLCLIN